MPTPKAQIDAIVTGAGLTIPCNTFAGGAVTRGVDKNRDPGALFARPVPGTPDIENVRVGFTYDQALHGAMMPLLRKAGTDRTEFSIGQIVRDGANNRSGLTTYTGILVSVPPAEGDTNAETGLATVELEFACSAVSG